MFFAAALMGGIATPAQADTPPPKQVFIQDGADNTIVAEKKELNLKTDDTTVIEEDEDFNHFPHHDLDHDLDHHDNESIIIDNE
ncbi:hypothetical protein ACFWBF_37140 [Streptomyces sp. NPDC060028]|uniref:hypothetical protein n=1 Tax=Streptomyces sp. NPDC060028 TaxID=3347041 RepID=UPI0036CD6D49